MLALSFGAFQLDNAHIFPLATDGMIFEHVPPHVVSLAMHKPNDHYGLLDTGLGVVFWYEAATEFK